MSTTFGVKIMKEITESSFLPDEAITLDNGDVIVPIAFRSNNVTRFTNIVAHLLHNDMPVYAMDNGNQGIHTIKDIKVRLGLPINPVSKTIIIEDTTYED